MSIYEDMQALLNEKTWVKKSAYQQDASNDKMCLLGAREIAYGASWMTIVGDPDVVYYEDEVTKKLASIIEEQFPDRSNKDIAKWLDSSDIVYCFNDHNATTIADIHLVLEKADADS